VTVGRDDYVKLTVASLSDIIRDLQHLFAGLDTLRHSGAAEIDQHVTFALTLPLRL